MIKEIQAKTLLSRVRQPDTWFGLSYSMNLFTITTADDDLARKLEPGASTVSARLRAMRVLADHGIYTGVSMMPILPFIEGSVDNVARIVEQAHAHGASYIIPAFGMTMRDRQRAYYYERLDRLFPGLRARYEKAFGASYDCRARNAAQLARVFRGLCERHGIATHITPYESVTATQLSLF